MATETKSSPLAQNGHIIGPALGVVIALAFILAMAFTGEVSEKRDALNNQISQINTKRSGPASATVDGDLPELRVQGITRPERPERQELSTLARMGAYPMSWQVVIAPPQRTDNGDQPTNGDVDPRAEFDALDRNDDGVLRAPDEITSEQLDDMDYDDSGDVSWENYQRYKREGPVQRYEIGPPTNVAAAVDPAKMEVLISWTAPSSDALPPDLGYIIERRAPETVEARMATWRQHVRLHQSEVQAWQDARDRWLAEVPEGAERPRRDSIPHGNRDSEYEKASGKPRPVQPPQPEEWERVTETPVGGTEYRDNTLELGVTYTYAVRAVTQERLRRGVTADTRFMPPYSASARTAQDGRPVLVQNRIAMQWSAGAGQDANIRLAQWLRHEDGGRVTWYRISITENLSPEPGSNQVGREYNVTELEQRGVNVRSSIGADANVRDILGDNGRVDFTTTFEYLARTSRGFLMNSRQYGDFELPRETREAATVTTDSAGMMNPLELVVMSVGSGGNEATVVLTRWIEANGDWYRVVLQQRVSRGSDIGRNVTLGSVGAGDGIAVFDSSGGQVAASALRGEALRGKTVDLRAGSFGGISGRTVNIGGKEVDLFGVLYVE